jgi:glycosidase
MAKDTPLSLKNLIIYSIYVRNHSQEGTFQAVTRDLPRIKKMGVDVIWLMPIHPIGMVNRKGTLGCPYSITDYRSVNPEYGTLQDFRNLVAESHALGMKVMIDVVYNHTAHDSLLVRDHPDFFHQDAHGRPITTVPDWSDVIDLKHPQSELTRYLIDSLKYWVTLGVDGFRCDVASLIPAKFWQQARDEVAEIKPGVIWLAESVHAAFIEIRRQENLFAISDSEIYSAFDLTYDYDIWPIFQQTAQGKQPVKRLLEMYRFQHAIYPSNFIKMHCVENHDQDRILKTVTDRNRALAWTAFEAFNDGAWLIYAGQEAGEDHTPSLFEKEPVRWKSYPLQDFITKLNEIKKHPSIANGTFLLLESEPAIQAAWKNGTSHLYGIFNVNGKKGSISVHLPDGDYRDAIANTSVNVRNGKTELPLNAIILETDKLLRETAFFSELMD